MTIEEIRALSFNPSKRQEEITTEMQALLQEKVDYESRKGLAKAEGNTDDYFSLQIEIEKINDKLTRLGMEYNNPRPQYNTAEVKSSWKAYIEKRNKIFEKKLEAYQEAKRALCKQFIELAQMQREVIKDANKVKFLLNPKSTIYGYGLFPDGMKLPVLMKKSSPISRTTYNGSSTFPDLAFFVESGDLPHTAILSYNEYLDLN